MTATVDDRRVIAAQRTYDESVDNWIRIIGQLNSEILQIYDLMDGYAKGKTDEKYNISSQQYAALKDQFNLWKSNLREPDKVLEHLDANLKKQFKERTKAKKEAKKQAVAADVKPVEQKADAIPKVAVFKMSAD